MAIDYDELRPDVKESQDDSLAKAEPARQAGKTGTPGARPGESELIRRPNVLGDAADRWPKSFCFVACSRRVLVPSVAERPRRILAIGTGGRCAACGGGDGVRPALGGRAGVFSRLRFVEPAAHA